MGKLMCKNLLKAGYHLVVLKRSKAAVYEVVAAGATAVDTPKAVAEQAQFIITMLPNSPNLKALILGENDIIEGAEPGTVVIDMNSIAPLVSKAICTELETIGVEMLNAPVSGGEPKAGVNLSLSMRQSEVDWQAARCLTPRLHWSWRPDPPL